METIRVRTKKSVIEDAQRLREWLSKQTHLPKNIDKELLTAFAHGTKSLEIAKRKLDSYLSACNRAPHLYGFPARDPCETAFKEASEAVKVLLLPNKTKEGYVILMIVFDRDFSNYNHNQCASRVMMLMDLALIRWPDMAGIIILFDLLNLDSTLFTKISLATSAFFFRWLQNTYPMKLKIAVLLNAPTFFDVIVKTFIKPFLSKKLFDRFVITADGKDTFKKYVDDKVLPSDYGGERESTAELNDYWMEELIKNRDWFLKTSQLRVDESKRPPDEQDSFGIQGTFRSLGFD